MIRVTPDRKAVVEDKPEVRKAGGVYYTPAYIVEYIVKNTVGKLLEGKTPRQAAKLKILDPACGAPRGAIRYCPNGTTERRYNRSRKDGSRPHYCRG